MRSRGESARERGAEVSPELGSAMRTLALDAAAAEIIGRLTRQRTPVLLLKGPVTARWLYGAGEARPYLDIDLLVPEMERDRTVATLDELGYRRVVLHRDSEPDEAEPWRRERDAAAVDLHTNLWGVDVYPAEQWSVLSEGSETMTLAAVEVRVPSPAVRTWLLAAHAAKHGRNVTKVMEDLRRALDRLDADLWREAARVAERLGATDAFSSGLRLVPAGQALADRLGLPEPASRELILRAEGSGAGIPEIDAFLKRRGARAKLRFLTDRIAPTPTLMRRLYPLARRGRWSLVTAYALRPFDLARRTLAGMVPWWKARKIERARNSKRDTHAQ